MTYSFITGPTGPPMVLEQFIPFTISLIKSSNHEIRIFHTGYASKTSGQCEVVCQVCRQSIIFDFDISGYTSIDEQRCHANELADDLRTEVNEFMPCKEAELLHGVLNT